MQAVFLIKSHMLSESLTANHLLLLKKEKNGEQERFSGRFLYAV